MFVTYVHALLLGVLQGVTEFLPVSSTAHLLLASRVLGYNDPGGAFTVLIQLGSILAVMWLYRARLFSVLQGLPSRPESRRFAVMLFVAFVPALVAGALFSGFVKTVLFASPRVIGSAFLAGGIVMLLVERYRPAVQVRTVEATPVGRAAGIGVCQTLALVPGVSRSGATIVGGMLMGLDRPAAAEFSFFLAMPTMAAAFVHDLIGVAGHISPERGFEVAIGFVAAFLSSAAVVRPFLSYVSRKGFAPFAWYRIVAGLVVLAAASLRWF